MASGLSSNVGRIINFPGRGTSANSGELLKVVLPLAIAVTWRLLESRQKGGAEKVTGDAKAAGGKAKATAEKKVAGAAKGARKRRSARYYAVSALITALENPTSRKLVISGLKLARNLL